MTKYNEVNYIHYCLKEKWHLEEAKEKLLKLMKTQPENGKLYALLAEFSTDLDEKKEIYMKGLEFDPISPQIYWGMFQCNLIEEDYDMAKVNLSKYREFMQRKLPCNTCLIDILLDEILGDDNQEYVADDYYLNTRLKGERYSVYCEILLALQNEEYDEAYTKLQYFTFLAHDLNMQPIFKLLNTVMMKRNSAFQNVKLGNKR